MHQLFALFQQILPLIEDFNSNSLFIVHIVIAQIHPLLHLCNLRVYHILIKLCHTNSVSAQELHLSSNMHTSKVK